MNSFLAEFKNFVQPLAIIFIFSIFAYKKKSTEYELLINKVSKILILFLCLNTLWIFLGLAFEFPTINQYFARGVSINAAGNNRFSGIFNQPMESGIAYSIGILSWYYLVVKKSMKIGLLEVIQLVLVIIGGVLSVSKIFIFGGLVLFVINVLINKKSLLILKKLIPILLLIFPIFVYYLISVWDGISYFSRLFSIDYYQTHGFIYTLTAGRFGEGAVQQSALFSTVFENSPIIGMGMGSQLVYDSAFFHIFSSGGSIALIFYLILMAILMYSSIKFLKFDHAKYEGVLFLNITLLVLIANFGSSVLTVNRASVIVWVFISLIYVFIESKKRELRRGTI